MHFDLNANTLTVAFADGDVVSLDPSLLLPQRLEDVDWWRVAFNDHELVVPHAAGWFEIPWDVVRMQTDAAFDAHMTRSERASAPRAGSSAA